MKFAVVGCGAVGSYYGAMLARAGRDVHFLLRSDYEIVRRHGVSIRSPAGNFKVRPRCARTPDEIGGSDVVLIALKTTANDQFAELLPPLVRPDTIVVTLQNGLGNEEQLARVFPPLQIVGGICFVGLNRTAPGVIEHLGEGMIRLGEFAGWPEPRTQHLATVFRDAGVPCNVTDNLARARWEKLVWNIPFNGLGVLSAAGPNATIQHPVVTNLQLRPCLTTFELLADPRWARLVEDLMREIISTAIALGHKLDFTLADRMLERTRVIGAYKASTLLDFELGRPIELDALFNEPLRQAQRAGVETPLLSDLTTRLQELITTRATQT